MSYLYNRTLNKWGNYTKETQGGLKTVVEEIKRNYTCTSEIAWSTSARAIEYLLKKNLRVLKKWYWHIRNSNLIHYKVSRISEEWWGRMMQYWSDFNDHNYQYIWNNLLLNYESKVITKIVARANLRPSNIDNHNNDSDKTVVTILLIIMITIILSLLILLYKHYFPLTNTMM